MKKNAREKKKHGQHQPFLGCLPYATRTRFLRQRTVLPLELIRCTSKIGFCRRTLSSAARVLLVGRLCLFSSSLACRASVPPLGIGFPRPPRPSPFLSPGASLQSVFHSKLCPSSPPCPLSSKQLRPSAQRSRLSSALPPSMTSLPASLTRKRGGTVLLQRGVTMMSDSTGEAGKQGLSPRKRPGQRLSGA